MTTAACARSQTDTPQPLASEISSAFHAPAAYRLIDSGRVLSVIVDLPPTPEFALRVAQFARAHYDSIARLDAIEVRFEHDEIQGQFSRGTRRYGGMFFPAVLPTDTTAGWVERMLAPPPTPALAVDRVKPGIDTIWRQGGFSNVVQLRDTMCTGHPCWLITTESRSTNGHTLSMDGLTVDKATLRPIQEQRTDPAGTVTVHYDGAHLKIGLSTHQSGQFSRDTMFAVPVFSAEELEMLLPTLPLAEGYTARLPIFRAHSYLAGLDWVTVMVSGVDTTRNAWVVEAAGTNTRFERRWIRRAH